MRAVIDPGLPPTFADAVIASPTRRPPTHGTCALQSAQSWAPAPTGARRSATGGRRALGRIHGGWRESVGRNALQREDDRSRVAGRGHSSGFEHPGLYALQRESSRSCSRDRATLEGRAGTGRGTGSCLTPVQRATVQAPIRAVSDQHVGAVPRWMIEQRGAGAKVADANNSVLIP